MMYTRMIIYINDAHATCDRFYQLPHLARLNFHLFSPNYVVLQAIAYLVNVKPKFFPVLYPTGFPADI